MKRYGLIGKTLAHSFSKKYFTDFFARQNLADMEYQNFEIADLETEIPLLKELPELSGLNVTIPYKSAIMPFLDETTEECREIGACNCIAIEQGRWSGHNTDITGFEKTFSPHLRSHHKKALILGSGGASGAVAFVLKKLHLPYLIVSRKSPGTKYIEYSAVTGEIMQEHQIIINTTPLGMFPELNQAPDIPYEFAGTSHYFYDLVYNPAKTLFLQKGERNGATIENGSEMLIIQAQESWKIWNRRPGYGKGATGKQREEG